MYCVKRKIIRITQDSWKAFGGSERQVPHKKKANLHQTAR